MKNKILLIVYVVLAAALVCWAYPIVKNRYFNPNAKTEKYDQENKIDLEEIEESEDVDDDAYDIEDNDMEDDEEENEIDEFLEVTNEDCENDCVEFAEEEDLQYCRQICGLVPLKETSENNCENLTGLEKDYCLKDLAIIKKDFKICQEIKDINIRKTCQNRITEEILSEEQKIKL